MVHGMLASGASPQLTVEVSVESGDLSDKEGRNLSVFAANNVEK